MEYKLHLQNVDSLCLNVYAALDPLLHIIQKYNFILNLMDNNNPFMYERLFTLPFRQNENAR